MEEESRERAQEREKTQLVKIITITRRRRRCPYWFVRKVFPSPSSLSLRFYWWMVSVQCGLSVTKYWRIKMMLRKRKGVIYKLANMLDVNWLVVSRWISERKSEREIERERKRGLLSPPLITFVYHIYLHWFSFFFVVEARRARRRRGKKGFVNWKREREREIGRERETERKRNLSDSSNNSQSTQTFFFFNLIFFFNALALFFRLNRKNNGFTPFGQTLGR